MSIGFSLSLLVPRGAAPACVTVRLQSMLRFGFVMSQQELLPSPLERKEVLTRRDIRCIGGDFLLKLVGVSPESALSFRVYARDSRPSIGTCDSGHPLTGLEYIDVMQREDIRGHVRKAGRFVEDRRRVDVARGPHLRRPPESGKPVTRVAGAVALNAVHLRDDNPPLPRPSAP